MSDTECDLDTLTALLEDSDHELGGINEETQIPKEEEHQKKSSDDCDLEELTSFLEQSDSDEDDDSSTQDHTSSKVDSKQSCKVFPEKGENGRLQEENLLTNPKEKPATEISALEAKMLQMQKEMLALQAELLKQKKQSSDSESSTELSSCHKLKSSPVSNSECPDSSKKLKQKQDQIAKKETSTSDTTFFLDKDQNPFFPAEERVPNKTLTFSHGAENSKNTESCADLRIDHKKTGNENAPPSDKKAMEQSLFGDSDSDWEELDGEEKTKLSDVGSDLKSLLKKSQGERVSHATKDDVLALRQKAFKTKSWNERPFKGQVQIDKPPHRESKENDTPSITDPFSNIRIVNPKVSSLEMKQKMQDRRMIKVSHISMKSSSDLQGNWVTIGVVVHRTEPRTSASGKTYCIWKLSDLQNCDKTITFFLFGEVYKQHWKNEVKTVVGLLNPNPLDKAEKSNQDVAFTVSHPNQVLIMGYSKDLGKCAGSSKSGKSCTNVINKQQGEYCTYHVQAAYRRSSSKRTELQGGAAITPKNQVHKQKKNTQDFFFYGGETFTNMRPASAKKNDQVTVKKLQAQQASIGRSKITTMSLHNLEAADEKRLQQLQSKDNALMDLISTPTVGSMNIVKHLMKKEKMEIDIKDNKKESGIQSVSAKDLLKQHKDLMRQRRSQTAMKSPQNPLKVAPQLGKGCNNGLISLDAPRLPKLSVLKAEKAKQSAIDKIQEKGGIVKEDPNAVKRKKSSPEVQERIRKRIIDEVEQSENPKVIEPPKKKSKLLGNINEDSEEFKALMKTKSKHTGALAEAELEQEERYFMELEKKEKYEEKMGSIMEMKCTVFTCKVCKYTAFKPAEQCKKENHILIKCQASKRFFKCKKCGRRTQSIYKLPKEPCTCCGENVFERTSMLQERKAPKLPHEDLSIRGDEVKFVNSMNQKVFLNL